jgi:AraC-like DNA-binding protein
MKLNYLLDVHEKSISLSHTVGSVYRQLPFYITECGHFFAKSGYFTEREGKNDYLIIFTVSGSGVIRYRGQEYSVKQGQVFMIDCNEYHFYKTGYTGSWEIKWMHFSGNGCESYFNLINENSLSIISILDYTELDRYMNEIMSLVRNDEIMTDIKASMIIGNIVSEILINKLNPLNNKKYQQHTDAIKNVIAYIQNKYNERINMRDFLKVAHMSEFHFIRLFKKYTGIGPYEYLINYRINKSKYLLKETNYLVNEISERVGFNNVNNFIRDFKKLVGTTPLKYRNYWLT